MAKITIIGSSGSGKTVLISVLAERFKEFLIAKNWQTKEYTAENYEKLVEKQEWPASTGTGGIKELEWELICPGKVSADVHVFDTPGQDLEDLYCRSRAQASNQLKKLKDKIDETDIIVLVISLEDILNGKTYKERESLKFFLLSVTKDVLSRDSRTRVAILLSQYDRIKALLAQDGVTDTDPREAIRKYLPNLEWELKKVGEERVYVNFIASVWDVEAQWNPSTGTSKIVPKKKFSSYHIEEFIDWLRLSSQVVIERKKGEFLREKKIFDWKNRREAILSRLKEYSSVDFVEEQIGEIKEIQVCGRLPLYSLKKLESRTAAKQEELAALDAESSFPWNPVKLIGICFLIGIISIGAFECEHSFWCVIPIFSLFVGFLGLIYLLFVRIPLWLFRKYFSLTKETRDSLSREIAERRDFLECLKKYDFVEK